MSARPVIRQLAQLDDFATLSDAAAGTASLRTLGTGATQAAAGNHGHAAAAITSGVLAMARLATGTPDGTKFVRDDGTLQVPPGAGDPALGGDLSGTASSAVVADDSHNHTTSTISGLDAADTTTGTFAVGRIPSITAAMVAADVATQAELDASALLAPLLAPATAARNTLQPSADVPALTLKARAAGQTAALQQWTDDAAVVGARVVLPDPLPAPGNGACGRLDFPEMGSGHGPVNISAWSTTFDSPPIVDPCIGLTYNYGASGGVPIVAGEAMCAMIIEGDYSVSGTRTMEAYFEGVNNAGTKSARPFFSSFTRAATTKELLFRETVISGGTAGIYFRWGRDAGDTDMVKITPNSYLQYAPDTTANSIFRMKAAAGRGATFSLGYGGTDDIVQLLTLSATNGSFFMAGGVTPSFNMTVLSGGPTSCIGGYDNVSVLTLINATTNNGVQGLRIEGKNGQTANHLTISRNTGSVATVWSIGAAGHETFGEAVNMIFGTTTGTKIGTATGQKLAFHDSAPVIQRAGAAQVAVATTGAVLATFGYTTAAQADGIVTLLNEIRATLVEKGLMKGAA